MLEVSGSSRIVREGFGVAGRSGEVKIWAYKYIYGNLYHTMGNHDTIVLICHN